MRFAPARSASNRSASINVAPRRFAPASFARRSFAPAIPTWRISGFAARHSFHATTLLRSTATCLMCSRSPTGFFSFCRKPSNIHWTEVVAPDEWQSGQKLSRFRTSACRQITTLVVRSAIGRAWSSQDLVDSDGEHAFTERRPPCQPKRKSADTESDCDFHADSGRSTLEFSGRRRRSAGTTG